MLQIAADTLMKRSAMSLSPRSGSAQAVEWAAGTSDRVYALQGSDAQDVINNVNYT